METLCIKECIDTLIHLLSIDPNNLLLERIQSPKRHSTSLWAYIAALFAVQVIKQGAGMWPKVRLADSLSALEWKLSPSHCRPYFQLHKTLPNYNHLEWNFSCQVSASGWSFWRLSTNSAVSNNKGKEKFIVLSKLKNNYDLSFEKPWHPSSLEQELVRGLPFIRDIPFALPKICLDLATFYVFGKLNLHMLGRKLQDSFHNWTSEVFILPKQVST